MYGSPNLPRDEEIKHITQQRVKQSKINVDGIEQLAMHHK